MATGVQATKAFLYYICQLDQHSIKRELCGKLHGRSPCTYLFLNFQQRIISSVRIKCPETNYHLSDNRMERKEELNTLKKLKKVADLDGHRYTKNKHWQHLFTNSEKSADADQVTAQWFDPLGWQAPHPKHI